MAKTFEGWDEEAWDKWRLKLSKLSVEQLRGLSVAVGVSFGSKWPEDQESYILVLDEAKPEVLEREYQKIIRTESPLE